mmetsp:Transcript_137835/g.243046  ORF Transcript_137835/g.243046 Transcript_137835/m.243046 type:complete len:162 (+) Transcript_137835:1067-1552(+)
MTMPVEIKTPLLAEANRVQEGFTPIDRKEIFGKSGITWVQHSVFCICGFSLNVAQQLQKKCYTGFYLWPLCRTNFPKCFRYTKPPPCSATHSCRRFFIWLSVSHGRSECANKADEQGQKCNQRQLEDAKGSQRVTVVNRSNAADATTQCQKTYNHHTNLRA